MPVPLGLDYAGGVPAATAIAAAGYTFVCRYLSPGGAGLPGKLLTRVEYLSLQSAGIGVVLNWETAADRMKAGYGAGVADATAALSVARFLSVPDSRPIYFSADWDATEADQTAIDAYLIGAAFVLGVARVGVYGSFYVCQRALDNGTATWAWQAAAWSGGQVEPRAHIYQRIGFAHVDGVECDVNEARQLPDFGQHPHSPISGVLDMPAGVIAPGAQTTKLVMPVGPSVSSLVARGWLSLASTENGTAKVWVQGAQGGIGDVHNLVMVKDKRWWIELPDGTDQMTVQTDSPGSIGWCIELQAR
jgi:hypothetical protein